MKLQNFIIAGVIITIIGFSVPSIPRLFNNKISEPVQIIETEPKEPKVIDYQISSPPVIEPVAPVIAPVIIQKPVIDITIEVEEIPIPEIIIEIEPITAYYAPPEIIPEPIIEPKISMKKIEIISPIRGKGLDREYVANSQVENESNYVELGLVVYDDAGEITKMDKVVITATDETQSKTINTTGNVTRIYTNGVEKTVYYYPFHYEFKTAGDHIITFEANGLSESVTLKVTEK